MFQKKYYYSFKNIIDEQYTIEIWVNSENTITAEEITGDQTPFKVTYSSISNKFEPIRGSGCDISLLSNLNMKFIDLYQNDMQGCKVKCYKSNELIWIGYLNSELYSEPFDKLDNYTVTLTANDGLALLERINYIQPNGMNYSGFTSIFEVIQNCLTKLNLEWNNIFVGLSTWSNEIEYVANSTILHQTFVYNENFYDEDGFPMSCREVVETILKPFAAYLQIINANVYISDINYLTTTQNNTTTTTTTQYIQNSQIYFDINGNLCINNPTGQTFDVTFKYELIAQADNIGTNGQDYNSSNSILYVNGVAIDYCEAIVTGNNYPNYQDDYQTKTGTTTLNNITDITSVKVFGRVQCEFGRDGRSGLVQVWITSITPSFGNSSIIYPNNIIFDCTGDHFGGTTTTTTTTFYIPNSLFDLRKYNNEFEYIENIQYNYNIGDVSNVGFASASQNLNVIAPINKNKITFSPYITSNILEYIPDDDQFTEQVAVSLFGNSPNIWVETLYNNSLSFNKNSYCYFAKCEGFEANKNEISKYLKIKPNEPNATKFTYTSKLPKIISSNTYYLKIEAQGYVRTASDFSTNSNFEYDSCELQCKIKIGDKWYDDTNGWVDEYTNATDGLYLCFSDFQKNKETNKFIGNVISDRWVECFEKRLNNTMQTRNIYVPLTCFNGHNITFIICGYKTYYKFEQKLNSYDLRIKDIKITIVDNNKNEVENNDIEYISYLNSLVQTDNSVELKCGTNINNVPIAKGTLLKKAISGYTFYENFIRNNTTDTIENLLAKSIKSNYFNPSIEIQCTINNLNSIFGYLTYSNYLPNIKFGILGAVIDYHENTTELVMQQIEPDNNNLIITKNY